MFCIFPVIELLKLFYHYYSFRENSTYRSLTKGYLPMFRPHRFNSICWFLQLSIRFIVSCLTARLAHGQSITHLPRKGDQLLYLSSLCKRPADPEVGPTRCPLDTRWGLVFVRAPQRAAGRVVYRVAVSICCTLSPSSVVCNMCIQGNMLICFITVCVILSYLTS